MISRVGVVGLGFFGKILLNVLREMPDVEVVAVHDRFPEKANEIELLTAHFYNKLEDMFDKESLDAVVIAEIPGRHLLPTQLAAAKGIHVFCEKPMANNLSDCDMMIDVCAKNHVKLMIGFKHRFTKAMANVKRDLPKLGRPYWAMYTYPLWKVDDPGWKFDENGTKGIVVENMVHAFDVMRYFFGVIRSLFAEGDHFVFTNTTLPDSAIMVIRFANGAIGGIGGGCTSEQRVTREYLDIHFEKGIVQVSGQLDQPYNLRILMREDPLPEDRFYEGSDGVREEIKHFIDCVRADKEPMSTGTDEKRRWKLRWRLSSRYKKHTIVSLASH